MYAFIAILILLNTPAFAQDMSGTERYETAYIETRQGNRYVGKCTTHQDHKNKYFTISGVMQSHVVPQMLSEEELQKIVDQFTPKLLGAVLNTFRLGPVADKTSLVKIIKSDVDDMTVETLSHKFASNMRLVRFNLGVGNGNGGYATFLVGPRDHKLMSYVFDETVEFCDKKVWLPR
jgi:hypothetical protein